MNESARKKIVYLAFLAAVIWGIYNFGGNEKSPISEQTAEPVHRPAVTVNPPASGKLIDVETIKAAPWGSDPFRIKAASIPGSTSGSRDKPVWKLSGIVYNASNPMAILNSRPVRVGDTVNNAKVKKIGRKSVTLEHKGNQFTITVNKG